MKGSKRQKSGRRTTGPAATPGGSGAAAEPLDVSWREEEIRAAMLWEERTVRADGVEPESVEEE